MPKLDLDAAKMRCEEATPGPWESDGIDCVRTTADVFVADVTETADATFIAHARTDLPAALAECAWSREMLRRAKGLLAIAEFPAAPIDTACVIFFRDLEKGPPDVA